MPKKGKIPAIGRANTTDGGPMKVEELSVLEIGLSTNAANALARNGIPTVGDILKMETFGELFKIRGLGTKSRFGVILKMHEMGYTEWVDKVTDKSEMDFYGVSEKTKSQYLPNKD